MTVLCLLALLLWLAVVVFGLALCRAAAQLAPEPPGKCPHDPRELAGHAIGMYHCPECCEMVLAGYPHPDYRLLED